MQPLHIGVYWAYEEWMGMKEWWNIYPFFGMKWRMGVVNIFGEESWNGRPYKKIRIVPQSGLHAAVCSGGRGGRLAGICRLPHGTSLLFKCILPTEWISNHICKYHHKKKELKYWHNHFYSTCCKQLFTARRVELIVDYRHFCIPYFSSKNIQKKIIAFLDPP